VNKFMKQLCQRSHVLWRLYRAAFNAFFYWRTLRLARHLSNHSDVDVRKIAAAVKLLATGGDTGDRQWVERIEAQRLRLLNDTTPLVDGTLGEPGIYDGNIAVQAACAVSKPPRAAFFLYCLARAFDSRKILELGTNVGISAAYLVAAGAQGPAPRDLVTLESSRYRQRIATRLHEELGLTGISYVQGLFAATLVPALEGRMQPDLAFIDGHHQYQPTLDYLDQVAARARGCCIFVFDDIDWSDGMQRAWKEIRNDARFSVVVDLQTVGVCVLAKSGSSQRFVSGPTRIF
jgi:predicted O-methyltransferase YrrM